MGAGNIAELVKCLASMYETLDLLPTPVSKVWWLLPVITALRR